MKLCPQCAFIYEDEQRRCDMDGKELVHDPTPLVIEPRVASPTRLTINIPARSQAKRFSVLIMGGVVLAALLPTIYFIKLFHPRTFATDQASMRSPDRFAASDSGPLTAPPNSSPVDTPLPEQSAQRLSDQTADHSLSSPTNVVALSADSSLRQFEQTPSTPAAPTRARLTFSPVSAGSPTGNRRGPVILRLINGPTIQADEAWEKREGIWYRQGGVVTFLKRGRVKTIEQSLRSTPKSATHNMEERNRTSGSQVPQNQLRIRRLEAAETKKPSRITSFLKSAGRAFKKPFKF